MPPASNHIPIRPKPYTAETAAREGYHLDIQCLAAACAHQVQQSPRRLIEAGHGRIHLDYLAKRLRCTRCGGLGAKLAVVF